ncbi:MAG: hypothetical protein R3B13_38960 [Polyangiaceae bacterium]
MSFVDGQKKRVHFFASRLKYSAVREVTLVENERVETILRCLARDFVAFGGLPLMAVSDRPKTIVKKRKGREVEEFNQVFAQAIVDIGVGVEMCALAAATRKVPSSARVGWVKSSVPSSIASSRMRGSARPALAWHLEVNTQTPSRATGAIPEIRQLQEPARLRPVKVFPETLPLRIPVVVGPTAEVMFEGGAPYSMPPKAAHAAGPCFCTSARWHHRRGTLRGAAPPPHERRASRAAA